MNKVTHFQASLKARVRTRIEAGVIWRVLPVGLPLALILVLAGLPATGLRYFTAWAWHNLPGEGVVIFEVDNSAPSVGGVITASGEWHHNTKTLCEPNPSHSVSVDWGNGDVDVVDLPCIDDNGTDPHPYSGVGTSYETAATYEACATLYHGPHLPERIEDVTCVGIVVGGGAPPDEGPPPDEEGTAPTSSPEVGNIAACADGLNPVVVADRSATPSVPGEWLTLVGFPVGTHTVTSGSRSATVTVQAHNTQAPSEEEWGSCTPASEVLGVEVLPGTGFAPAQRLNSVAVRALVSAAMVTAGWALRRLGR